MGFRFDGRKAPSPGKRWWLMGDFRYLRNVTTPIGSAAAA